MTPRRKFTPSPESVRARKAVRRVLDAIDTLLDAARELKAARAALARLQPPRPKT